MSLKRYLETLIRGWLPKKPILKSFQRINASRPSWWKPLWVAILVSIIAFGYAGYFLSYISFEKTLVGIALAFFFTGIAYYIRVKPSMKVNRAIYILIGISPIGFGLWLALAISGLGIMLTSYLGVWPSLIIGFTVPYIMGAFIGDWIGKRRNYRLPLNT